MTAISQEKSTKRSLTLLVSIPGRDEHFFSDSLQLQTQFNNKADVSDFINKLPDLLTKKGYPFASIDSVLLTDTTSMMQLFLGEQYSFFNISLANVDPMVLEAIHINDRKRNPVNSFHQIELLQERILHYYEDNGYPFASVSLDSIRFERKIISAVMNVEKGMLYHIDSIRLYGDAIISNSFLQHYLFVFENSYFDKSKLKKIDNRIVEIPFLKLIQPSDVTMLGTGAILNLYLDPKKCSQANFLLGVQPSTDNNANIQLTGDINLNLKNSFGRGENILLKWQQLQKKSPRLNLAFSNPYIFQSIFGLDFLFELFKKDSSFIQINTKAGLNYLVSENKTGRIFVQLQNTSLLSGGIDTNRVKASRTLPSIMDTKAVNAGVSFEFNNTNYKFNPRKGNEFIITGIVGTKVLKSTNEILSIKDPSFDYSKLYDSIRMKSYQLRFLLSAAHYFPLKKTTALKIALNSAWYYSPEIFKNDLFQIGGYKLLRGFDEESIYASGYGVASIEYRILLSQNSYFSGFTDLAYVKNKYRLNNKNNTLIGAGLSLAYETKSGLLNISYGIGKQDDIKFNLKNASKIHFGYINYF